MADWQGELRLAFVDTDRVTFYTHPDDEKIVLDPGKRYACVLVEISDQETSNAAMPERRASKAPVRQPSNIAAILCKDYDFQLWASAEMIERRWGRLPPSEGTSEALIKRICGINSRSELDSNQSALDEFHRSVEIPYYRWKESERGEKIR